MEEDRLATNLGPEVSEGLDADIPAAPKQPKRRFVGRRAAEAAATTTNAPNGSIEESTAIQGVKFLSYDSKCNLLTVIQSLNLEKRLVN
jgi:hypothetical protein